jgi:hypothetical protein
MNFRTTIILLILLAVAGLAVYFTQTHGGSAANSSDQSVVTTAQPKKLFDFPSTEITQISVQPATGSAYTLERQNLAWRLTQPVTGPADPFKSNDLADAIAGLTSTGQVSGSDVSSTGIDPPRFVVKLTRTGGLTTTINVGDRTGIGTGNYVRLGPDQPVELSTTDLTEQLGKSPASFRRAKLLDVGTTYIHSLDIDQGGKVLSLIKKGPDWQITQPVSLPADPSLVDDLLYAITGMTATNFTSEDASDAVAGKGPNAAFYRLDRPTMTITFTAQPAAIEPTTQASTRPDETTTLRFGGYSDITRANVYLAMSNSPSVVTVPVSVLDSLKKTPLDLRDRKVVAIDPSQVQSVTIQSTPTGAKSPTTLVLARRPQAVHAMGPVAPATNPATASTTAPAAAPTSKWIIASAIPPAPADDARVMQLLNSLNPLRAVRYLPPPSHPAPPSTAPDAAQYLVTFLLKTQPSVVKNPTAVPGPIHVTDRGNSESATASYNGIIFELPPTVLEQLKADYKPGATPTPPIGADTSDATPPSPNSSPDAAPNPPQ